jgi:hypothetical protein
VADGVLTTDELTILIGPAAASPAKAVAATAPQMAAKTLDLICLFIAISFFHVPDRPNMTFLGALLKIPPPIRTLSTNVWVIRF